MFNFIKKLKRKKNTEKVPEKQPEPVQATQTFDWTGRSVKHD